jgi:hypothetical protein
MGEALGATHALGPLLGAELDELGLLLGVALGVTLGDALGPVLGEAVGVALGPSLGESLDAKSSAHGLDEILSPALERASSITDTHKTWEDPSCSPLDLESG